MSVLFRLHTPASRRHRRHGEAVALDLLRHSGPKCSGWGGDECPAWWQLWGRVHFIPAPDTLSKPRDLGIVGAMLTGVWWCHVALVANTMQYWLYRRKLEWRRLTEPSGLSAQWAPNTISDWSATRRAWCAPATCPSQTFYLPSLFRWT